MRISRYVGFIVVAGLYCGLSQTALGQESDLAVVHLDVRDSFGNKIDPDSAYFYNLDEKMKLAMRGRGTTIRGVPFGRYWLVTTSKSGGIGDQVVFVSSQEMRIRCGIGFPQGDRRIPGGDFSMRGVIGGGAKGRDGWWVRVEGLYQQRIRDVRVEKDGSFVVSGLEIGKYLVLVLRREELVYSRTVTVDPTSQPFEIEFPGK